MHFSYSTTHWGTDDGTGWNFNQTLATYNKAQSMLTFTNIDENGDNPNHLTKSIKSIQIHMAYGHGTFGSNNAELGGNPYYCYMYAEGSDGVTVKSNTIHITNQTQYNSYGYNGTEFKTFTFEGQGIQVNYNATVTLYMYFQSINDRWPSVVAVKHKSGNFNPEINTRKFYITFNTSTGVQSFTGSGSYDHMSEVSAVATAKVGYLLKNYKGLNTSGEEATWTGCSGLSTHTDTWIVSMDRDITVYADPITYQIKYNKNGNNVTGTMINSSHTYNITKSLTANLYQRTGYTFIEWNDKPDGSGQSYANQAEIINLSSTNGQIINLYAIWEAHLVSLTFDPNGGQFTNVVANNGSNYVVERRYQETLGPLPLVTKNNHNFIKWVNPSNQEVTSTHTVPLNSTTFTALWSAPLTYTINYITDKGTITDIIQYNAPCTIRPYPYQLLGYKFVQWTTNEDKTDDGFNWTNWSGAWTFDNGQFGITDNQLNLYAVTQLDTNVRIYHNGEWRPAVPLVYHV